jgi:hypothetical protein
MTSAIGVFVADAGYHGQANLTAPGPARLIADGKARDLARREPAEGPPPEGATAVEANAHRLRALQGRALDKRRAPDVEGLHASLKDRTGPRRFSLRGLRNATSEFLLAGIAHNLRLLAAISRTRTPPPGPAPRGRATVTPRPHANSAAARRRKDHATRRLASRRKPATAPRVYTTVHHLRLIAVPTR